MDAASLIQKLFPRGTGGAQGRVEWLVTGLGNPGAKYRNTRHNVGWWALDELARRAGGVQLKPTGAVTETAEINIRGVRTVIARPTTYVNKSGEAVRYLLRKHNLDHQRLIVIYDDLNLEPGKVRIRAKGGAGGHNGMKSIIASLGTQEFARIRIGIGKPTDASEQVDHVLGTMAPKERQLVEDAATRAAEATEIAVTEDIQTAMNRFNA